MNITLENTTFVRFNVSLGINHTHLRSSTQIQIQRQIILLVEQIQIPSLCTFNVWANPCNS